MVGRDVEQHGDVGAEVVHVIQLERRELDDVVFVRFLGHLQGQRVANVTSQTGIVACGLEDVVDEARRGGLSVGTRNADHLRRGVAPGELDLADDGDARSDGLGHHGGRVGDAGTLDDLVSREDEALGVLPLLPGDVAVVEHLLIARGYLRHVTHEHVETFFLGQYGGSCTALAGSEDDNIPTPSPSRGEGGLVTLANTLLHILFPFYKIYLNSPTLGRGWGWVFISPST